MSLFYSYIGLLLTFHINYLSAYQCHECNGMTFNYSITIDNIPPPNTIDCDIVKAENGCSVRVTWLDDGTSEIYYNADLPLPLDTVVAKTERRVKTWSGEYTTQKYITYNCKAENTTPCNTVEKLGRAIDSTIFPTHEQIKQFDRLIVPTIDFYGSLCFQLYNGTNCPGTDLLNCQQCMGIVHYTKPLDICAMCPAGKAISNFIDHEIIFFLNNRSRLDIVRLGCRRYGACNTIGNIEQIQQTLISKFDFNKFSQSTASTIKSTVIILFLTGLFRSI